MVCGTGYRGAGINVGGGGLCLHGGEQCCIRRRGLVGGTAYEKHFELFYDGRYRTRHERCSGFLPKGEHQYTYVGNAAGNTSVTTDGIANNNGIVDLFGWVGASSNWTGLAQYGISSSKATDNVNGYGNVDDESLKSDWGTLIGTGWRTLTSAEWTYLLNTREGNRYCKATVHSTTGLIIFPDEITWNATTMGDVPTTCNTDENDNFTYSPTDANWAALEAAGCVFLPAAGTRDGTSVGKVGSDGCYWSSTPLGSNDAFYLDFSSGYVSPASNLHRYFGYSVRLVQDQ